jgi:hypothetical protein
MCRPEVVDAMQLETKFMRLPMPVSVGLRFDDWQVTWGYWTRHRLSFLVMVVRVKWDSSNRNTDEKSSQTTKPARNKKRR